MHTVRPPSITLYTARYTPKHNVSYYCYMMLHALLLQIILRGLACAAGCASGIRCRRARAEKILALIKMPTRAQLIADLKGRGVGGKLSKMTKSQLLQLPAEGAIATSGSTEQASRERWHY
jgi:hypothetical protein